MPPSVLELDTPTITCYGFDTVSFLIKMATSIPQREASEARKPGYSILFVLISPFPPFLLFITKIDKLFNLISVESSESSYCLCTCVSIYVWV